MDPYTCAIRTRVKTLCQLSTALLYTRQTEFSHLRPIVRPLLPPSLPPSLFPSLARLLEKTDNELKSPTRRMKQTLKDNMQEHAVCTCGALWGSSVCLYVSQCCFSEFSCVHKQLDKSVCTHTPHTYTYTTHMHILPPSHAYTNKYCPPRAHTYSCIMYLCMYMHVHACTVFVCPYM